MRGFTAEIVGCHSYTGGHVVNFCNDCPHSDDECDCEDYREDGDMDLLYIIKLESSEI